MEKPNPKSNYIQIMIEFINNFIADGIMGEENIDFGELFGELIAMKEHAASLTPSNRRAAAEQSVKAFWKAMGGDPSEVEGLDE